MFFIERYFSVNVNFIFVASIKIKIADQGVVQYVWKDHQK